MQPMSFRGPLALGERRAKAGARQAEGQLQQRQGLAASGNWLTAADELLTLVVDDAPWEQKVMTYNAAKSGSTVDDEVDKETPEERISRRCAHELQRPDIHWFPITMDTIKEGHTKRAPGIFYGLEFPWNEDMLVNSDFGHKWLTQAFHTAGTLPKNNWVTKVIREKDVKVTGGNNGGKFFFEVRYAKKGNGLHTHLFAKVPFEMNGPNQSDRLSSSFYKQPMDFFELQTYRLMESALPFATPRFYYGDISNETTNFILITERVQFSEHHGRKRQIQPYEIEGPFDKCKDFNLRQPHKEYYLVMLDKQARIAAKHKTGGLPSIYNDPPTFPEAYGVDPTRATGENPANCASKLDGGLRFICDTAKVVFPEYVTGADFKKRFKDTMMKLNAYTAEITYFKNAETPSCSVGHQNLNVDNAYFWRDDDGVLDCGIFDFGGFGSSSLPHKVWWMLNMAEFENIKENMDEYIDFFVNKYHEYGGPLLDKSLFRFSIMVTALQNCMVMVSAIPNALKQCPTKEWQTIKDRHDPRIADNIDKKSTLRTNIHVLNITVRLLMEMDADKELDGWISDVWCGKYNCPEKSDKVIYDTEAGYTSTTRW